jgi:alpha-L-fucosidase
VPSKNNESRSAAMAADTPAGPFAPTWESLSAHHTPDWYIDGKFGIFIHWGAYCVPAFGNEWYPRNMYRQGTPEFEHHLATYGPHSQFGYKDFLPRFTAERFDADAWAELFRRAGARFVVPVAEHHDGFAMYDSALSQWTAARMGPMRDIVGQLAQAVRSRGMTFGLSSHRAEHWWFFDAGRTFDSDVQDARFEGLYGPAMPAPDDLHNPGDPNGPDAAFLDDWLARCCELVDRYRPQLVWFDWWIENQAFEPYLRRFAAYYYNRGAAWGQGVAINYKHAAFPQGAAVFDVERGQLSDIRYPFWQTDTSVSKNSWGYVSNHDYKQAGDIIGDMVDIVSKNGALLLNIGPRADGTIPEPEQRILEQIGAWLAINGEAIYETRPWKVYGEGPTNVVGGSFNDTLRQPFTSRDLRFTTRGDTLYAIALGRPSGQLTIESLATNLRLHTLPIGEVRLLGHAAPLPWTRDGRGLHATLPEALPGEYGAVLRITPA